MTTFKSQSGSKMVKVSFCNYAQVYRAFYVQVYQGEEQVLDSKTFKTENNASKWAAKMLAA
jgi:hypothetical protein